MSEITRNRGSKDFDEAFMIDLCCGGRHWLFDKDPEDCLFMDIRSVRKGTIELQPNWSVDPDLIGSYTDIPFDDSTFRYVFWDIPHAIKLSGIIGMKYGQLGESWRSDIEQGFREIHRILEHRGALIFKFADTSISHKEIMKCLPIDEIGLKPILGTPTKKGVNNTLFWFFVNYKEGDDQ